jgi:hypothetical protein
VFLALAVPVVMLGLWAALSNLAALAYVAVVMVVMSVAIRFANGRRDAGSERMKAMAGDVPERQGPLYKWRTAEDVGRDAAIDMMDRKVVGAPLQTRPGWVTVAYLTDVVTVLLVLTMLVELVVAWLGPDSLPLQRNPSFGEAGTWDLVGDIVRSTAIPVFLLFREYAHRKASKRFLGTTPVRP